MQTQDSKTRKGENLSRESAEDESSKSNDWQTRVLRKQAGRLTASSNCAGRTWHYDWQPWQEGRAIDKFDKGAFVSVFAAHARMHTWDQWAPLAVIASIIQKHLKSSSTFSNKCPSSALRTLFTDHLSKGFCVRILSPLDSFYVLRISRQNI